MILWKHLIHSWHARPCLGTPEALCDVQRRAWFCCSPPEACSWGPGRRNKDLKKVKRSPAVWADQGVTVVPGLALRERLGADRLWLAACVLPRGLAWGTELCPFWTQLGASFSSTGKWSWLQREDP